MKKEVRTHLLEHAKTMAGTVRETHWVVPGRVRARLFPERGAKASTEGSREGSGRIFHDFRSPLGCPWGTISQEKWGLEMMRNLDAQTAHFSLNLEGPAEGVWLPRSSESAD